jgi:glycosyltransferase involved in cell wall biosynthesis
MLVANICATLAPFDVARLAATSSVSRAHQLAVIEIAGSDSSYRWNIVRRSDETFGLRTLFPSRELAPLSFAELRPPLWRALDDVAPDVVVIPGWTRWGLAALAWCLAKGVAAVLMADSQRIDSAQSPAKKLFKRLVIRGFDAAFVAGTPHRRWVVELGMAEDRCFDGCDVVDNNFFAAQVGCRTEGKAAAALVSCLRLIPIKNVPFVLHVLAKQARAWRWRIAGDGPDGPWIAKLVRDLGLESRVELLGHANYESIPAIHGLADIYLQPSVREPWGLAVNEAMASGLPVLVSNRCGCHEDLVREGINGYTFDPFSEQSLAAALDRLLLRRAEWPEMGRASQRIIGCWGLDRFAQNFWRACEAALRFRGATGRKRVARRILPHLISAFSYYDARTSRAAGY